MSDLVFVLLSCGVPFVGLVVVEFLIGKGY